MKDRSLGFVATNWCAAFGTALQLGCSAADGVAAGEADLSTEASDESPAGNCFDLPGTGANASEGSVVPKGLSMNGLSMNGMSFQGMQVQGMNIQGMNPQGMALRAAELRPEEFRLSALNGAELSLGGARLSLEEGVLVATAPLLGAALDVRTSEGRTLELRIERIDTSGGLTRYGLSAFDQPVCANGELGIFISGAWSNSGEHLASDTMLTYACESGVLHKCAAWGYAPWQADDSYYQTCTRMARADYCGDGQSWTREHTLVNIYDQLGVQVSEPADGLSFEAAWGPDGAVCVNDSRYQVLGVDGTQLLPNCWAELPRCQSFAEAGNATALIADDSQHTPIEACAH